MMANTYKRMATFAYHSSPSKQFNSLQCISESESINEKLSDDVLELSHHFDYEECSDLVNLPEITERESECWSMILINS